jgi:hypothetical protein
MKTWFLVRKHDGCPDVYFKRLCSTWDMYGAAEGVIPTCDKTEAVGFSSEEEAEKFREENGLVLWTFEAFQLGKENE